MNSALSGSLRNGAGASTRKDEGEKEAVPRSTHGDTAVTQVADTPVPHYSVGLE